MDLLFLAIGRSRRSGSARTHSESHGKGVALWCYVNSTTDQLESAETVDTLSPINSTAAVDPTAGLRVQHRSQWQRRVGTSSPSRSRCEVRISHVAVIGNHVSALKEAQCSRH